MSISRTKMLQVSKCLIGLAVMVLQSCDITDNRRDLLCGNWESVEGKPDVLIYKEGEAYKVTVFKRSGLRRKLKLLLPMHLLQKLRHRLLKLLLLQQSNSLRRQVRLWGKTINGKVQTDAAFL